MSKLIELVPPKKGLSVQEFHDHWRHPHGSLAQGFRPLRRYVQNHRIDSTHVGPNGTAYEGIVEATFDSADVIRGLGASPYVLDFMYPDEERFVDRKNAVTIIVEEEVLNIQDPDYRIHDDQWCDHRRPLAVKLFQFIAAGDESSDVADDVELGRSLQVFRQLRNHPVDSDSGFVGIRELWWPTLTAFNQGMTAGAEVWQTARTRATASFCFLAQAERLV